MLPNNVFRALAISCCLISPSAVQAAVWKPVPLTTWQWQLTGTIDQSFDVQVYDIDLYDASAATIASLHAKGRKVICYFSAGSYEDWRPDAKDFPAAVLGNDYDGWAGEKYLDFRNIAVLGPIMAKRLDMAVQKGCDAVEPDNIDQYGSFTGFPTKGSDAVVYDQWLADQAHARGLSIGQKNDVGQISKLVNIFDWALNEECAQYSECGAYSAYINQNKAVFNAEYSGNTTSFCPNMIKLKISSIKKDLNLTAPMTACHTTPAPPSDPPPTTGSACDLNGDSATNISDVQQCVNQAIGAATCVTGDIDKNGSCNVIDVQRVVNAAMGGQCVTQ